MRRFLIITALLLACTFAAADEAKSTDIEKLMQKYEKQIQPSEAKKEWTKIHWRKTMDDALADAKKEDKPLLVFLVVGERGKPHAENC